MGALNFPVEEIVEGRANLLVPKEHGLKGPGKRGKWPFYNRAMVFNRDISVLVLQGTVEGKSRNVLDGLSATGVLGIRFCLEVEGEFSVVLNDHNPVAFQLIQENIRRNGVRNATASCENLNALLSNRWFDYIDIDPFGSVVPFLDCAFQSLKGGGVLAATVTDVAPLCGTYPKTCMRRYGASPLRTVFGHEVGIRILLGYMARAAAKFDISVHPLLCYSSHHYFKVIVRTSRGARRADESLSKIGYAAYNGGTGQRILSAEKIQDFANAGPLWMGPLMDEDLVMRLTPMDHVGKDVATYVDLWREESKSPGLFYTTDELGKRFRLSPPPISRLLDELKNSGFVATRTHFDPKAFKTDADIFQIRDIFV